MNIQLSSIVRWYNLLQKASATQQHTSPLDHPDTQCQAGERAHTLTQCLLLDTKREPSLRMPCFKDVPGYSIGCCAIANEEALWASSSLGSRPPTKQAQLLLCRQRRAQQHIRQNAHNWCNVIIIITTTSGPSSQTTTSHGVSLPKWRTPLPTTQRKARQKS
jgi:hypothetical protein